MDGSVRFNGWGVKTVVADVDHVARHRVVRGARTRAQQQVQRPCWASRGLGLDRGGPIR